MRILITGSRLWGNTALVERAIMHVVGTTPLTDVHILHGAARGADSCADEAAQRLGIDHVTRYPADWKNLGRQAGFIRNGVMLMMAPDFVLAFKDDFDRSLRSGGTEHMVRISLEAGRKVLLVGGPLGRICSVTLPTSSEVAS